MKYMSWTFWRFDYAMQEIYDYGDRIYQLGMFDYITEFTFHNPNLGYFDKENVSGVTGRINLDVDKNSMNPNRRDSWYTWLKYIDWVERIRVKWPHIKWFLSIRNDGTYNAIKYLMDDVNGVQDIFLSEINRILDENPWCAGIDLDLEHCGGKENSDLMINLVRRVSELIHSKGKLLHYDVPAMNGENYSIGSQNWCSYTGLNPYLDTVTIMSYDFAWQGSAPMAVSPKFWLDIVYAFAVTSFDRDKVFMGLPGYGYCWQIYNYPNPNDTSWYGRFRGHTMRFDELIKWQNGLMSHNENQPKIPFASYVKDDEKCAYMYLHVYDYQGFDDATVFDPAKKGEFGTNKFISTYKKLQNPTFENIVIDRQAVDYDRAGGNLVLIEYEGGNCLTSAFPVIPPDYEGQDQWGYATYLFNITETSIYDIVLDLNFNWFDRDKITIDIGTYYYERVEYENEFGEIVVENVLRYSPMSQYSATIPYLHYTFALNRHYDSVATIPLEAGQYYIRFLCELSKPNAFFYGFKIAKKYQLNLVSGKAKFTVQPQSFLDSNLNEVKPQKYKLTFEVLRREPDYCYIWSDDFRSYVDSFKPFDRYYIRGTGTFSAVGVSTEACTLVQSESVGYTEFKINYTRFPNIYVKIQFKNVGEEVGILIGNNKVGLKDSKIRVNGGAVSKTVDVKSDMNELTVRIRDNEGKIWFNGFELFTTTMSSSEIAGMYSINSTYECYLFEVRDSHNMYLQECMTVTTPAGTETLGRVKREVSSFDMFWNTVYVNSGQEEIETRTDLISTDWDYLHTQEFTADGNFDVDITFDDIGFWLKAIYLCDSNGSSVAFYNDISSYIYWFNECTNKYKLKGSAIWCTGEENPLIYQYLDKEV